MTKESGEVLKLSQWVQAEPCHQMIFGAFGAEKNAFDESSFSAVNEIIAFHKIKPFIDGENCKTEAYFYRCISPM